MSPARRLPGDQAEVVFGDAFVEYLDRLPPRDREAVLSEVVALCRRPGGDHPLGNRAGSPLAGWRTLEVLERRHRVVFSSRVVDGVGVIHVLCAGPRRASAVYDTAAALVASGRLSDEEATQIWDAIILLQLVAETLGLDGWDYLPPPASDGEVRAAVAAGILEATVARLLSERELRAAMREGWGEDGPDPDRALAAAIREARSGIDPVDITTVLVDRQRERCGVVMPRARARCIRRRGHPGPHRARA